MKQATMVWHMAFNRRREDCEGYFHAWQLREDQVRHAKTPEQRTAAQAVAANLRASYNLRSEELVAWVIAHPAPEEVVIEQRSALFGQSSEDEQPDFDRS